MRLSIVILCVACIQWIPSGGHAQWSHDPNQNNPLCTAPGDQSYPGMVSDGEGGAIVAWSDGRAAEYDIYAQHINAGGHPEWAPNGIPVCVARNDQTAPTLVSDGAGGAIITWTDKRSGDNDIYAQRLSRGGAALWQSGGVPICTAPNDQVASTVVSDGSGGAIVTWRDLRSATSFDIYAQRVSAAGELRWLPNGIPVCTAPNRQTDPAIASDGSGGAIITWLDNRTGKTDIYVQRVTAAGLPSWTPNGVLISESGNDQRNPAIIGDGAGGGIIAWRDARNGSSYDIYAQRVNPAGSIQWAVNGNPICTAAGDQESPQIINDGLRGAIIAWADGRNGSSDIFAQHVDVSGAIQWAADGIAVCKAAGNQVYPAITKDGLGGAIMTWLDYRHVEADIYAQRVNALGAPEWPADGVPVCTAPGERFNPTIVNGTGRGAIIAWYDYRSGLNSDIFAQRVDRVGYPGDPAPRIAGLDSSPGDGDRRVTLMWSRSYLDTWPDQTVTSYAIWKGIRPAAGQRIASLRTRRLQGEASLRPRQAAWGRPDDWLSWVSSVTGNGNAEDTIYWEYIASVKPHWLKGYSYAFPVHPESVRLPETQEYFMVTALTSNPLVYWDSEVESSQKQSIVPLPASQLSSQFSFRASQLANQFAFPPSQLSSQFAFPSAPQTGGTNSGINPH